MREKETRESVEQHFKPYMDTLAAIENVPVEISNDRKAQVVTELSMMDGKMIDLIQGDSGAFCHYCNLKIRNGFKIEKLQRNVVKSGSHLSPDKFSTTTNPEQDKCTNYSTLVTFDSTASLIRNFSLDHMEIAVIIWFWGRLTCGQKLSSM